jgi:hypothetical protein
MGGSRQRQIKAELKRADVGYAELARRLTDMGLPETEGSVTVKINRGAFPAWFLFAVMQAIGAKRSGLIRVAVGFGLYPRHRLSHGSAVAPAQHH